MRAAYRRKELDRLVDFLDFDDEVAILALVYLYPQAPGVLGRGLVALTQRCLIYVHRRVDQARRLPYSQILQADTTPLGGKIIWALPAGNASIEGIGPRIRVREFADYIRDRVDRRR
jgi:hypothetical protein